MLCRVTRLLVSLMAVMMFISLTAGAQNEVSAGSDYLKTGPGTFFDLSARGFGTTVGFQGKPNGPYCQMQFNMPCSVDTIIQRQQNSNLDFPAAIPVQITYLSLVSTAPNGVLNNNTFHYRIYATLDPRALPNNTGTMTIMGNTTGGGTFDSMFTVNALVTFVPTDGGPNLSPFRAAFTVQSSGTMWTPTAPASPPYAEVVAPYPAQQASVHTGLPLPPQLIIVDFFFVTFARELHFAGGPCHVVSLACVVIVAVPPPNILFFICVPLGDSPARTESASLEEITDAMMAAQNFGGRYNQNLAWSRAQ